MHVFLPHVSRRPAFDGGVRRQAADADTSPSVWTEEEEPVHCVAQRHCAFTLECAALSTDFLYVLPNMLPASGL